MRSGGSNRPTAILKNRPQYYQHGDYHPGDMIIAPDGSLFVIDWNRDDFGDPWEEFNRIQRTDGDERGRKTAAVD
jgi:aminoglycoside phosphotransferase (APT) family kinase protein